MYLFFKLAGSIEKQKFWLDKDAAWTIDPSFVRKLPQLKDARLKVECLET